MATEQPARPLLQREAIVDTARDLIRADGLHRLSLRRLAAVDDAIAAGAIVATDPLLVSLTLWTAAHGVASALRLGLGLPADLESRLVDESIDRLLEGWSG